MEDVKKDGHAAEGGHGGHAHDPMEHIKDEAIFGIDSASGKVVFVRDTPNYHASVVQLGPIPFKLEFTKHMASFTFAALLICVVSLIVSRRVLAHLQAGKAPHGPLANLVEATIVFVRDEMVEPMGGHHLGHYTPLFILYFLLIATCNYLGMIPDAFHLWGTATGNYGITAGLAITVYLLIWILGVANQGPINFIIHLVPPGTPWWLWPVMLVLELLGPVIKCFVLSVRLFANMIAGHLIISQMLSLGGALMFVGVPLALGVSLMELLVCVLQAYVFTLLSCSFIGSAVHPEH
ncbi:MAG: F0F1 ATP synthase subunit A [Planctomycetota bacterium]